MGLFSFILYNINLKNALTFFGTVVIRVPKVQSVNWKQ